MLFTRFAEGDYSDCLKSLAHAELGACTSCPFCRSWKRLFLWINPLEINRRGSLIVDEAIKRVRQGKEYRRYW